MRRPRKLSKNNTTTKRHRLLKLKNHPFIVPVTTLLVLLVITVVLYIRLGAQTLAPSDSHVAIVSFDKKQQTIPTKAPNVGELLKRLDIKLYEGDIVEPTAETPIVEDNFRINVYRARPVIIEDNGHKTLAYSAATTSRSIAAQAGITVYPEDNLVKTLPDSILKSNAIGEEVVIDRATPAYLNLYGTAVPVRTHAKSVGDLLKEKNVQLEASDTVEPALTTTISTNSQIFVIRKGTQIATVEETVAPPVQTIEDASLSFGTTVIRQKGTAGKKLVTYQIDLQNGKEVGRHKIQEVTVQEPVEQIVGRGKTVNIAGDRTGLMAAAGIPSSDYAYVNYIISRESNWRINAVSSSGCYGLGQSCPGSKLVSACPNWQTDGACQLQFFGGYASRYGGWGGAYNFWLSHGWW